MNETEPRGRPSRTYEPRTRDHRENEAEKIKMKGPHSKWNGEETERKKV